MRIFFPNASIRYPPTTGGHIHVYQLTRQLRQLGHEIISVQPDQNPITCTRPRKPRHVLDALRTADVIYCRLEESPNNATRLTSPGWNLLIPDHTVVVWELNVSLTGAATVRGRSDSLRRRHLSGLQRSARRVDGAICVTKGLGRQATELLSIERVAVIQNGSDPDLFRREPEPDDRSATATNKLQVVSIGSNPNSYHDIELLEALCALIDARRLPIDVHLYGKSAELCGSALPCSLHVHGPVSYLEMPRHLSRMDVGLALYNIPLDLGSPLKLFDYLASGCVPVCSGGQAVEQVLAGNNVGLVASSWTPESLSKALLALHEDRSQLERMRVAGRLLVEREYNWTCIARKTEVFLTQLMLARPSRKAAAS